MLRDKYDEALEKAGWKVEYLGNTKCVYTKDIWLCTKDEYDHLRVELNALEECHPFMALFKPTSTGCLPDEVVECRELFDKKLEVLQEKVNTLTVAEIRLEQRGFILTDVDEITHISTYKRRNKTENVIDVLKLCLGADKSLIICQEYPDGTLVGFDVPIEILMLITEQACGGDKNA